MNLHTGVGVLLEYLFESAPFRDRRVFAKFALRDCGDGKSKMKGKHAKTLARLPSNFSMWACSYR